MQNLMSPRQTCSHCLKINLVAGIYPPGLMHGGRIEIVCGYCSQRFTPPAEVFHEYAELKEEAKAR